MATHLLKSSKQLLFFPSAQGALWPSWAQPPWAPRRSIAPNPRNPGWPGRSEEKRIANGFFFDCAKETKHIKTQTANGCLEKVLVHSWLFCCQSSGKCFGHRLLALIMLHEIFFLDIGVTVAFMHNVLNLHHLPSQRWGRARNPNAQAAPWGWSPAVKWTTRESWKSRSHLFTPPNQTQPKPNRTPNKPQTKQNQYKPTKPIDQNKSTKIYSPIPNPFEVPSSAVAWRVGAIFMSCSKPCCNSTRPRRRGLQWTCFLNVSGGSLQGSSSSSSFSKKRVILSLGVEPNSIKLGTHWKGKHSLRDSQGDPPRQNQHPKWQIPST